MLCDLFSAMFATVTYGAFSAVLKPVSNNGINSKWNKICFSIKKINTTFVIWSLRNNWCITGDSQCNQICNMTSACMPNSISSKSRVIPSFVNAYLNISTSILFKMNIKNVLFTCSDFNPLPQTYTRQFIALFSIFP